MTAVKAYYDGAVFVPVEPVKAKRNQSAIVTILDFSVDGSLETGEVNDACRRQMEALVRFRDAVRSCDELVPEFERIQLNEIDV